MRVAIARARNPAKLARSLLVAAVLFGCERRPEPRPAVAPPDLPTRFDALVPGLLERSPVPGVQIAVIHQGAVAWHGSYVPYKYDLARFMVINTVSFDHADPSIFTVLTSPSGQPGVANCDFVIFPPRWLVAEHSFRPPWFHRNVMSELMGLVHGVYDAKAEGFAPGGASLHNCMTGHGPDAATFEKASNADLTKPDVITGTMAFMFETRAVIRPTRQAVEAAHRQRDYQARWAGLQKHFAPPG